jgi:hypothetical protein
MTPEQLFDESEYVQQLVFIQRFNELRKFLYVLFFHGHLPFINPGQERLF